MIASAESKKILVRAQAISKNYTMAKGELTVLNNISLDIHEGEFIVILGPSGAGKSTFLHILGILDKPSSGDVFFENTQVSQLSDVAMARLRNARVGFVFQFHYLLPEFTALENVIMPALIAGKPSNDPSSYERGKNLLKNVGLAERYYHRPSELSGGEQQRVAFARALMNDPGLILADEPSGNLDKRASEHLHQLMFDLCREFNKTFVVVTHNEALAERAQRVIRIEDGGIDSDIRKA